MSLTLRASFFEAHCVGENGVNFGEPRETTSPTNDESHAKAKVEFLESREKTTTISFTYPTDCCKFREKRIPLLDFPSDRKLLSVGQHA